MWLFIAGATSTGQVAASAALVSRLSARPWASLAIVFALAGAIRRTSALRDELEVAERVVVGRALVGERAAGGVALELVGEDGRAGERREGRGADEPLGGRGLDDPHGMPGLRRQAHDLERLVGGDPAADAEQDSGQLPSSPVTGPTSGSGT